MLEDLPPPDLSSLPSHGDVLLIVPPFALLDRPSLAAHLLQACARMAGFEVRVLYANLHLASVFGEGAYSAVCVGESRDAFLGERVFSRAAFGQPLMGRNSDRIRREISRLQVGNDPCAVWSEVERLAKAAGEWADQLADAVVRCDFEMVGATTTFSQTCAAIALLDRVKQHRPEIVTLLGGGNCEGVMAEGIASATGSVDFIFSGESEASFPSFLRNHRSGRLPLQRVVFGASCADLDSLPDPDFSEYFDQLASWLPYVPSDSAWLPYEASRGCWWGEKSRCTFCGFNRLRIGFREKSPQRVRDGLVKLAKRHSSYGVAMADNVMPTSYFDSLIPDLAENGPNLRIFFEQRPSLSLEHVIALKRAGVTLIQMGIEALSPALLRRMEKGCSVAASIRCLRYARSTEIAVYWNLLCEVPGDQLQEYEETLALLPLIRHLAPTTGLGPVRLDRFSRYVENPDEFGIRNLRPLDEYADIFPPSANLDDLANFLDGDYPSASRDSPEIIDRIEDEIMNHRELWSSGPTPPLLVVRRVAENVYLLVDTRGVCAGDEQRMVSREQALAALAGGPGVSSPAIDWALERKVGVRLQGRYVPLATARPELIQEFEEEAFMVGRRTA